jgi:hypothetical protein
MNNIPKPIVSHRLGVSYTKEISFSERLNKFFVVYKNFKRLPTKKKQVKRFDRLTRSPLSNDAKKLITADKFAVSVPCHHYHHNVENRPYVSDRPIWICLTCYFDDFPPPPNFGSRNVECRHQPTFQARHVPPPPIELDNDSDNGIGCLD